MNIHGAIGYSTIASVFTWMITDAAENGRQRIILHDRLPGFLIPSFLGKRQPCLDILPGRAGMITGRKQIPIDGSPASPRAGPGGMAQQVRQ
jgi:hypothetical protein